MIGHATWLVGGAATAAAHVWMLRRSARPPFRWAMLTAPLRLLMVAGVFVAAAWRHELLATAAGFGAAFPLVTLLLLYRDRSAPWATSRSSKNA